jgi:hypothetical protein
MFINEFDYKCFRDTLDECISKEEQANHGITIQDGWQVGMSESAQDIDWRWDNWDRNGENCEFLEYLLYCELEKPEVFQDQDKIEALRIEINDYRREMPRTVFSLGYQG